LAQMYQYHHSAFERDVHLDPWEISINARNLRFYPYAIFILQSVTRRRRRMRSATKNNFFNDQYLNHASRKRHPSVSGMDKSTWRAGGLFLWLVTSGSCWSRPSAAGTDHERLKSNSEHQSENTRMLLLPSLNAVYQILNCFVCLFGQPRFLILSIEPNIRTASYSDGMMMWVRHSRTFCGKIVKVNEVKSFPAEEMDSKPCLYCTAL
jgi:hypothetical protein